MRWKSLSHVQLFATPWTIHTVPGILQARILEWVAIPFSEGSSQTRGRTQVFCTVIDSLLAEPPGKPKNTGVGSLTLLQWIFLTQESNWGFLYCRQILYQLSYQGSPKWALTRYQIFWCLHLEFLNSRTVIYKLPDLVNSGSWWWTGRPGVLWFMGSQRVGHDWVTELNWTET